MTPAPFHVTLRGVRQPNLLAMILFEKSRREVSISRITSRPVGKTHNFSTWAAFGATVS
jgi:hypothetical protein